MSKARDAGKSIGEALRYVDFFYSMEALARLPAMLFAEYAPDPDRNYNRGEVVRVDNAKYLLQNWGRIDPAQPPPVNSLCKLFRDGGRYEWAREEYCIRGFERSYEGVWYRVTADSVDDATPPPNNPQAWERLDG